MARRLTTNQEIAGSIPASINITAPTSYPFCFCNPFVQAVSNVTIHSARFRGGAFFDDFVAKFRLWKSKSETLVVYQVFAFTSSL
jgi:hypothetical protein